MTSENIFIVITAVMTLGVAYVNGWTDAPNAIASLVVSRSVTMRKAVILAAVSDFAGSVIVGVFNGKVTETVLNIADFGDSNRIALLSLCAAMFSVILWAVSAWRLGLPTSESHALLAALTGASIAVNGDFSGVSYEEWGKVLCGLFVSSVMGFISGFTVSKITIKIFSSISKKKSDSFFKPSQLFASVFMAFMHGAQDSQKFTGILMLVLSYSGISLSKKTPLLILMLCPVIIAIGTASGGERIIKSVGMDMFRMRTDQGFSADFAGSLCLLFSTLSGMPVSTTHTKTSAVIGVGVADRPMKVNYRKAIEMMIAWVMTFPCCVLLGYLTVKLFLIFL